MRMSEDGISHVLQRIVAATRDVGGVTAIVLGGSRARGFYDADSDIDIGVYYDGDAGIDVRGLTAAAKDLDDEKRPDLIAPPGAWGKWVNGGGWLTMDGLPVDLILRDSNRVECAVNDCIEGRLTLHYQSGHPHAFTNAMYMGELAVCRILHDPDESLRLLREWTRPYPEKLRDAVLLNFGFEAEFSLMLAEKNVSRGDIYYVAAHLVRSVSCMNQVLFALNREYCLNEKKAVLLADAFSITPDSYQSRVEHIFANLGVNPARACAACHELADDVAKL